ncbi:MAG: sulfite exporter TauE/SafE family protein [Planctomycetota bacterium]
MSRTTLLLVVSCLVTAALAMFLPLSFSGTASRLESAGVCALGFAVGAFGTMIGAGGGFLIVPFLLLVYGMRPEQAAGTSLAVVLLNALTGTGAYVTQKRIDYRAGLAFGIASLPGAFVGSYLSSRIPMGPFQVGFGVLLLGVAALVVFGYPRVDRLARVREATREEGAWIVPRKVTDALGETFEYRYNESIGVQVSFFVGILSSVLGIGGGVIHVPALTFLLGFPPHIATATSHFVLSITAAAGLSSHFTQGHVDMGLSILMGSGAVCGAPVGARLARRMHGRLIMRLLAIGIVALAVRLLWRW